jgi:hypothetical protein
VQINFGSRSVSCKIVYYGPGLSGKTTNIQKVHELTPAARKSDLTSIKTEGDRTLFFDFMSLDLGKIAGMDTRFQLYTVPGQVYYNATRKLVIQGADGIVFVADSSPDRMADNIDSWMNLQDNLLERGMDLKHIPVVMQWNKRDVAGAMAVAELDRQINTIGAATFESVACDGTGVLETLKCICALVCKTLNAKQLKTAAPSGTPIPGACPHTQTDRNVCPTPQSMSFASRRVGAAASASAVMDPPAGGTAILGACHSSETDKNVCPTMKPAAPAAPLVPSAREGAPTPPKASPRKIEPVTASVATPRPSPSNTTVIAAASVAAAAAAALAAAWAFGWL